MSRKKIFHPDASFYDEDYFINGKQSGKSLYENYRWLPKETKFMANAIAEYLSLNRGDRILDYGCARGYLVKAFRSLGFKAFGCDISEYAISNCHPEVSDYLSLVDEEISFSKLPYDFQSRFDFLISKDMLEHIPKNQIKTLIKSFRKMSNRLYAVVPLGDHGIYRIEDYELDQSHVIAEDEVWWADLFKECGYSNIEFSFSVKGVKEAALSLHPYGNGHFKLSY